MKGKGSRTVKAKLQLGSGRHRQQLRQQWAAERHKKRPGTARQGARGR